MALPLSKNDYDRVRKALTSGRVCPVIEWAMPNGDWLTVGIVPAPKAWAAGWIIRAERYTAGVYTSQYFDSVEAMIKYG